MHKLWDVLLTNLEGGGDPATMKSSGKGFMYARVPSESNRNFISNAHVKVKIIRL